MILKKNIKLKIIAAALICAALCSAVSMTACGSNGSNTNDAGVITNMSTGESVVEFDAMDTTMTITAYGDNAPEALKKSKEFILELDKKLAPLTETGEIAEINKNGTGKISEDTQYILSRAIEINKDTDGAFNPIMLPVMQLWGFYSKDYKIPTDSELAAVLKKIDIKNIKYVDGNDTVTLENGAQFDFGGIAKGYASQKITEIMDEYGIKSALINLGGNNQVVGKKTDGSQWRIGIQTPSNSSIDKSFVGIVNTESMAVVTSGDYERYFELDGKRYHHIMDPSTGKPADNGLNSVTIVADDGTLADALSTSLFIMGIDKGTEYWKKNSDSFDVIFLDKEGKLYATEGLKDCFTSELEINWINK